MKTLAPPRTVTIGDRVIGPGHPVWIIAEISANHGHDFERARRLIEAAVAAGADAIKLQTYTPDTLTIKCDRPEFMVGAGTSWEGRRLYDLYAEAHMPWEWQPRLKVVAEQLGVPLFSTPFDETAVDFLEKMDVPCHKIASFELVDLPLLRKVAATGKPLIMSTGMATREEIAEAIANVRVDGADGIVLLKCTSAYPAPPESMNLRTMVDLAETFKVPTGLSDHTTGPAVPVAAVAMGARVIEKHITLSRADGGPDAAFSLEPDEFRAMVRNVRDAEAALGDVRYGVGATEEASRVFRRSLFVVEDVAAGEQFTPRNVRAIRPGYGLHTRHVDRVMGLTAARDIARGTPLDWELVGQ